MTTGQNQKPAHAPLATGEKITHSCNKAVRSACFFKLIASQKKMTRLPSATLPANGHKDIHIFGTALPPDYFQTLPIEIIRSIAFFLHDYRAFKLTCKLCLKAIKEDGFEKNWLRFRYPEFLGTAPLEDKAIPPVLQHIRKTSLMFQTIPVKMYDSRSPYSVTDEIRDIAYFQSSLVTLTKSSLRMGTGQGLAHPVPFPIGQPYFFNKISIRDNDTVIIGSSGYQWHNGLLHAVKVLNSDLQFEADITLPGGVTALYSQGPTTWFGDYYGNTGQWDSREKNLIWLGRKSETYSLSTVRHMAIQPGPATSAYIALAKENTVELWDIRNTDKPLASGSTKGVPYRVSFREDILRILDEQGRHYRIRYTEDTKMIRLGISHNTKRERFSAAVWHDNQILYGLSETLYFEDYAGGERYRIESVDTPINKIALCPETGHFSVATTRNKLFTFSEKKEMTLFTTPPPDPAPPQPPHRNQSLRHLNRCLSWIKKAINN